MQEQLKSAAKTPKARVREEVEHYSNIVRPDPESNPLDWWKIQAPNYPILAKLAKMYLCICASSSASERLFSTKPLGTLLLRSVLCYLRIFKTALCSQLCSVSDVHV